MKIFSNPKWIEQFNYTYNKFEEIPPTVFKEINVGLERLQQNKPLVTILISAWNEEVNLLKCLASISKMETDIPLEVIVVNNNSKDKTQDTIDQLRVKSLFEANQGCGPARQLGQENALGEYVLLADADCFYPSSWVNEMVKVLQSPGVVCVYGRYSFISEPGFPRWKLAVLEMMKDFVAELRHRNRPFLNAYGLSMGYVKEFGLKVGFIKTNFWGDDGRLCLGLMEYGKIKQMKVNKARVWTGPRSLQRDGNFGQAIAARIKKEIKRITAHGYSKVSEADKVSARP